MAQVRILVHHNISQPAGFPQLSTMLGARKFMHAFYTLSLYAQVNERFGMAIEALEEKVHGLDMGFNASTENSSITETQLCLSRILSLNVFRHGSGIHEDDHGNA
ncbi:uncharacterized protein FIBRA_00550 [Fibroporia radiculosa]|uniref:Uncharacterized protein n=1 Tax=Fibroporia radiculosa TaxID=599839 RepID=J4GI19_9APHY|nr:uncharacterized protein FIBRA_00550 [Fibroporia radiculosa]CCL98550.1 predicted protein [Fibroporia radiculosa]